MKAGILYGIRNCDTVKTARAWLDQRGVDYRFHDYKVAGIDMARLDRWCQRPVLELNGRIVVGFKPEVYKSLPW